MNLKKPIIYLVDDDDSIRRSLSFLLESDGFTVKTFDSGEALLDYCPLESSGCILLDLRMPGMSGLQLQRALAARQVQLPIIFITGHGDTKTAVRAMKDGAVDFLEKPFTDDQLLESVTTAIAKHEAEMQHRLRHDGAQKLLARLSPRERDVVQHVIAGHASKDIAAQLGISARTVEAHRNKIMHKLEVRNVAELVRLVMSSGRGAPPPELSSGGNDRP